MKTVIALMVLGLTGCGTVDSIKNSEGTDYILVSQEKIGGIYGLFKGDATACKLTKHGITGLEYTIEFKNGECVVSAVK